jgi:hypothetical protein
MILLLPVDSMLLLRYNSGKFHCPFNLNSCP